MTNGIEFNVHPSLMDRLTDAAAALGRTYAEHVEMMAGAYLKHTGIAPDRVELVVEHTETGSRTYFRERR